MLKITFLFELICLSFLYKLKKKTLVEDVKLLETFLCTITSSQS